MVVPTFAALLPDTSGDVLSDERPLLRTMLFDELDYKQIFLLTPRHLSSFVQ